MISPYSGVLCAIVAVAPFTGCSRDAAARAETRQQSADSSAGDVASLGLPRLAYHAAASAAAGVLTGRVLVDRPAADSDTVATPRTSAAPVNAGDCGGGTDSVSASGGVANALVWIDSITTGKPLPLERRETFNVDRCGFDPAVLAVVSPTTINVFSRDAATHFVRFYRTGSGAVDSVRTVDEGEVVPSERIAAVPGIVEARDRRVPGARGFIATFNHPYFAVTDASGAFRIEGLQPGTYTIKVWHPDLSEPVAQRVVIGPGGTGRAEVELGLP